MEIHFDDARKAVRRGTRSASQAMDVVHDTTERTLDQARHFADDAIDAGDRAVRSTSRYARSAHSWIEENPHLSAVTALAVGVVLGALLSPRR